MSDIKSNWSNNVSHNTDDMIGTTTSDIHDGQYIYKPEVWNSNQIVTGDNIIYGQTIMSSSSEYYMSSFVEKVYANLKDKLKGKGLLLNDYVFRYNKQENTDKVDSALKIDLKTKTFCAFLVFRFINIVNVVVYYISADFHAVRNKEFNLCEWIVYVILYLIA